MVGMVLRYFKKVSYQKIILWCYLIWYFTIISLYFESSLKLWASAVGIALIIGFALILSTSQKGTKQDVWIKVRLFLFPFCVSSYSATIKDHDFILVFPGNVEHLWLAILSCSLFLFVVLSIKWLYPKQISAAITS